MSRKGNMKNDHFWKTIQTTTDFVGKQVSANANIENVSIDARGFYFTISGCDSYRDGRYKIARTAIYKEKKVTDWELVV